MKKSQIALVLISFQISFLSPALVLAEDAPPIQGKWIAKKYLEYGVEDGKAVQIKGLTPKPQHFGLFMYQPKQTLEITIPDAKENEAGKVPGKIRSDKSLLDPACSKSEDYKNYAGCQTPANTDLDLAFRFFQVGVNPSSTEKAMIAAWKKSGLGPITSGFNATSVDLSSHVGFVGKDHLLLRVNYFKNALRNAEDAFSSKCPKRNKCYIAFLQFDRVPAPTPAPTPTANSAPSEAPAQAPAPTSNPATSTSEATENQKKDSSSKSKKDSRTTETSDSNQATPGAP